MGIRIDAAGEYTSANAAVDTLANISSPYLQQIALAANASIADPFEIFAYAAPSPDGRAGAFVLERPIQPRQKAFLRRELVAEDLLDLLQAIEIHPRNDRLQRAMAHYRLALGNIDPENWVMSAEHLYIAVENLGRVVYLRLLAEAKLDDTGESKHKLAVANGFAPANDRDRSHLNKLDAWVRQKHIFLDDRDCFKKLLDASDKLEHGLAGFDEVRLYANASALRAFGYVRSAILREAGVKETSGLFGKQFELPVGPLTPIMLVEGTYLDSAPLGPAHGPWPEFEGLAITVEPTNFSNLAEGGRRFDLKVEGNGGLLTETQTITPA